MAIPDSVLAILICPETRRPLRRATAEELASIQRGLPTGEAPWEGALVCEGPGEPRAYPVRDGFPILLKEEARAWPPGGPAMGT